MANDGGLIALREGSTMKMQERRNLRTGQKRRREALLQEGLSGITVRDTLPNTSFPLTGEAEAMYFKRARDFLETSLAHTILCGHQDIAEDFTFLGKKR